MTDIEIKELLLKSPDLNDINILDIFNRGIDPKFLRALTQSFWVHEETDPNEDFSFVFLLRPRAEKNYNNICYKIYCSCFCSIVAVRFYFVGDGVMSEVVDVGVLIDIQKTFSFSVIEKIIDKFSYKRIPSEFLYKPVGKEIAIRREVSPDSTIYNVFFSEY